MIWQMIEDWFRGILTDGILSNLSGLFDSVNTEVGEIATQVGTTPAGWNAGIFNMIRSLHGACAPTAQAEPKRRLPDKIERFSPTRQLWKSI